MNSIFLRLKTFQNPKNSKIEPNWSASPGGCSLPPGNSIKT